MVVAAIGVINAGLIGTYPGMWLCMCMTCRKNFFIFFIPSSLKILFHSPSLFFSLSSTLFVENFYHTIILYRFMMARRADMARARRGQEHLYSFPWRLLVHTVVASCDARVVMPVGRSALASCFLFNAWTCPARPAHLDNFTHLTRDPEMFPPPLPLVALVAVAPAPF